MEVSSARKELIPIIYGATRKRRREPRDTFLPLAKKELSSSTKRLSTIHGKF
jgi:hypothetical protein